jgi:hypothetical protein
MQVSQESQARNGTGDASSGETFYNCEIDILLTTVDECTDCFGQRSPNEVCADSNSGAG